MATAYPGAIQSFPNFLDITAADAPYVEQYQAAMEAGDLTTARAILNQIPSARNKVITADLMNTIADTSEAVQKFYLQRYSPAYVVSATQPAAQEITDFWFKIEGGV